MVVLERHEERTVRKPLDTWIVEIFFHETGILYIDGLHFRKRTPVP